jgi:hypothetical protein
MLHTKLPTVIAAPIAASQAEALTVIPYVASEGPTAKRMPRTRVPIRTVFSGDGVDGTVLDVAIIALLRTGIPIGSPGLVIQIPLPNNDTEDRHKSHHRTR